MNIPLLPLIRQRYPTLSPTEKKIAACILDDPEAVVNETVTHLARRASTATSSVANFAQAMGRSPSPAPWTAGAPSPLTT